MEEKPKFKPEFLLSISSPKEPENFAFIRDKFKDLKPVLILCHPLPWPPLIEAINASNKAYISAVQEAANRLSMVCGVPKGLIIDDLKGFSVSDSISLELNNIREKLDEIKTEFSEYPPEHPDKHFYGTRQKKFRKSNCRKKTKYRRKR